MVLPLKLFKVFHELLFIELLDALEFLELIEDLLFLFVALDLVGEGCGVETHAAMAVLGLYNRATYTNKRFLGF